MFTVVKHFNLSYDNLQLTKFGQFRKFRETRKLIKIQACKSHENAQSRACYVIGLADQMISP